MSDSENEFSESSNEFQSDDEALDAIAELQPSKSQAKLIAEDQEKREGTTPRGRHDAPTIGGGGSSEDEPELSKEHSGGKTIFVTQQFRFFQDEYQRLEPIGEPGQFGTAYACYRLNDPYQKKVCVKEINKARFHHISPDKRAEVMRGMQNEISILKKVEHENIVQLYDVYEDRHYLFLVMEYLPGGELFDRICEQEYFDEENACKILTQILNALDYMHSRDIVHLDLKPDNILFSDKSEEARIKLIDFGMARVVPKLSRLKDRVGTPNYMAPEVLKGRYSKGADVWSVGVILFCMLFGYPPFYVDSDEIHMDESDILERKIAEGFLPEVREGFGPWFPEEIPVSQDCMNLLTRMLELNVERRWTVRECLSSKWVFNGGVPPIPDEEYKMVQEKRTTVVPIIKDALMKFRKTNKFKVAVSRIFAEHLDVDHLDSIRSFFRKLDTDNSGEVSMMEFKVGMKKAFPEMKERDIEQIFSNIDMDDSRGITIDEMITAMSHRAMVDEDERLYSLFNELDRNGDGVVAKEELEVALKSVIGDYDRRDTYVKASKGKKMLFDRVKNHVRKSTITGKMTKPGTLAEVDYEGFLQMLHPDFKAYATDDGYASSTEDMLYYSGSTFAVDYHAGGEAFDMIHHGEIKKRREIEKEEAAKRQAELDAKTEEMRAKRVKEKQQMRQPTFDMFKKKKRSTAPAVQISPMGSQTPRDDPGAHPTQRELRFRPKQRAGGTPPSTSEGFPFQPAPRHMGTVVQSGMDEEDLLGGPLTIDTSSSAAAVTGQRVAILKERLALAEGRCKELEKMVSSAEDQSSSWRAECSTIRKSALDRMDGVIAKMEEMRRDMGERNSEELARKEGLISEKDSTIVGLQQTIADQQQRIAQLEDDFQRVMQEKMALLLQVKSETDMFTAHMRAAGFRRKQ